MTLNQITKFEDLMSFLPLLGQLHHELDGIWEPDLGQNEFLASLSNNFNAENYYFGDVHEGKLVYFVVILRSSNDSCFFWLFYMNKDYRQHTKALLLQLKQFARELGFKTVDFITTRMTKSYDRWVQKFGATKQSLTYRLVL